MSRFMLSFVERVSPVHRLSGTTKFAFFMLWSILAMATYDTRVMLAMVAVSVGIFFLSRTRWRDVSFIFRILLVFMAINLVTVYLFAPEQGVEIYGTRHLILAGSGRWTLTAEQLFYELNIFLKYGMIVPIAIVLITTTKPSEFASSLNRIGVSYRIAYAISLTLRYVPDVQRDYENIAKAQQARGIDLSKKASPIRRLQGASAILMPLVLSSLERIDVIANAMELRGFGKGKKRTWYSSRPFTATDCAVVAVSAILFAFGMWITFSSGTRFWNPFTE